MKIKIILITIIATFLINFLYIIPVQANSQNTTQSTGQTTGGGSWVQEAFQAAYDFFNGTDDSIDNNEVANGALEIFKSIIKALNRILIVLLFGLSAISLSIIGIRYIVSGSSPGQREIAQKSLKTVFIGMLYGFGAFVIWNIAIQIIKLVIGSIAGSS